MSNEDNGVTVTSNKQVGSSKRPTEVTIKLTGQEAIQNFHMVYVVGVTELARRKSEAKVEIDVSPADRLSADFRNQMRAALEPGTDVKVGDLLGSKGPGYCDKDEGEEWGRVLLVDTNVEGEIVVRTTNDDYIRRLSSFDMHVIPKE